MNLLQLEPLNIFPTKILSTEVCQSRFCESYNKYFQGQDLPLKSLTFSDYRKHIKKYPTLLLVINRLLSL